jgi:triacylglycerol lipase
MNKPIPTPTFQNIRPPNRNYTYFEDFQNHPFLPLANTFELVNAGWLADLAMLAYFNRSDIKDRLDNSGLTAAGFVMEFFSRDTTQYFVVHNDNMVAVSIRGTEIDNFWGAFEDWLNNLRFEPVLDESGGLVHAGFIKDVASMWNDTNEGPGLKSYLQPLLAPGTRTLWITGHSLGAALATLVAERAARDGGFDVRGVYTYGSCRVGDSDFKQKYGALGLDAKNYRIVHDIDIAQQLFPHPAYVHVGQFKFIDANGNIDPTVVNPIVGDGPLPEPTTAQEWAVRLFLIFGEAGARAANALGLTIPKPFAEHAPIYYASYIWNNQ